MAKKVPGSITEPYKIGQGDFSPNLVGQQFTQGSSVFTLGNFSITTSSDPIIDVVYNTGTFSEPYTLETLNLTEEESIKFSNETIKTNLNLDDTDLTRFVYFGSFYEYIASNIKQIMLNWKGSLYLDIFIPDDPTAQVKNTVLDYTYDSIRDESYFKIPTPTIVNTFGLIYDSSYGGTNNQQQSTVFNPDQGFGNISNLNLHYTKYQISNLHGDFPVQEFTGTSTTDNYIHVKVKGDAWPSLSGIGFGSFQYHFRPKEETLNKYYFSQLDEFQNAILNRLTTPQYSYSLKTFKKTDNGNTIISTKVLTWPTTDGFNLDTAGPSFSVYVNNWLDAAKNIDEVKTDLITRRFISSSIVEFDTEGDGTDVYGRKVNKLLRIYGREFDEIKKYIDALAFSRIVTYDKKDNTPDELIKMMASELGLDVLLSFFDDNFFGDVLPQNSNNLESIPFSGYSRHLSPREMDTELWRRLVINAWWLFKSKGHRKVLEFFLNLFGIQDCVVNLDEHVYVAKNAPLDIEETNKLINDYLGTTGDTITPVPNSEYPIDEYGFPRKLPNTPDYYYQSFGFWYNGGNLLELGNNPHIGPYDYGNAYFDRFRCFIDGFNGTTSGTTTFTKLTNLFTDYENGTIESGPPSFGPNYATIMENNNRKSNDMVIISAGADNTITYNNSGQSLRIKFGTNSSGSCDIKPCPISFIEYSNGLIFIGIPNGGTVDTTNSIYDYILESDISNIYQNEPEKLVSATQMDRKCCINAGGVLEPVGNSTNTSGTFSPLDLFNETNSSGLACYWCPETKIVKETSYQTITTTNNEICSYTKTNPSEVFLYNNNNHILLKDTLPNQQTMGNDLIVNSEYKITFTLGTKIYGPFTYNYKGSSITPGGTIYDGTFYVNNGVNGNNIKISYNNNDYSQNLKTLFDDIKAGYSSGASTSEGIPYLDVPLEVKIEYNGDCSSIATTTTTETINYDVIKSINDNDITNVKCCTNRGGSIQKINNKNVCAKEIIEDTPNNETLLNNVSKQFTSQF